MIKGLCYGMITFLLLFINPGVTLAHDGADGGVAVKVGGYSINLIFLEPATTGENPLHVQVFDEMGAPMSGAQVTVATGAVHAQGEVDETVNVAATATSGRAEMTAIMPAPGHAAEHAGHTAGSGESSHAAPTEAGHTAAQHEPHGGEAVAPAFIALAPSMEAGEYAGAITFAQAGHTLLTVQLTINGESLAAQFPVEVARSVVVYAILAGFLVMNGAIIGGAAFLKHKQAPLLSPILTKSR